MVATQSTIVLFLASMAFGPPPVSENARRDQVREPPVSDRAPPLSLEQVLQAPVGAGAELTDLRGKVVVVEFWATWCGPCVASIPAMNDLHEMFRNEPVAFLSVTDEDAPTVRKFLRKHPISGWIGLDTDRSVFKAYGVKGIPRTAIISKSGELQGWTIPDSLAEHPETLEKVIKGEPVRLMSTPNPDQMDIFADFTVGFDQTNDASQGPLCLILVRPATGVDLPFGGTSRARRVDGVTMKEAIASFYSTQWGKISFDFAPPDNKYDILFRWPTRELERGHALLREAMEATFDITVRRDKRLTPVYVLSVEEGREAT